MGQIRIPVVCQITFPDHAVANLFGTSLLQKRLAACVQCIPGVQSSYLWEGAVQTAEEVLMLVKTFEDHVSDILALLAEGHPYDVPECIVIEMTRVLPSYLDWMKKETPKKP